ncbi:dihydrolipoamide succinyltransferase [Trametes punicea]|nr:dihydrolipoamide succinyltransferase [Trametes punicea]
MSTACVLSFQPKEHENGASREVGDSWTLYLHIVHGGRAERNPRDSIASRADASLMTKGWKVASTYTQRSKFHSTNLLKAETVKVPQMAESISEGTLKSWLKQPGDIVQADEEVATIETDKIDVSVNAPAAGRITELLAKEEDTVAVGQDLFRFEPGAADEVTPKEQKSSEEGKDLKETRDTEEPKDQQVEKGTPPPPSPTPEQVRKPDPAGVQEGTAKKEVKETSKPAPAPASAPKEAKEQPAPTPRVPGSRNETRVKMSRMRLRIAERLKESQNAAASLTTFNEIDMSSVIEMRKKYKDEVLKEYDVKLGYMSAFAKACCLALKEIPAANASIEGDEIVYRDYVDLSVAVATPKGLVTPVVRNAETMNFIEIEREIAALGKKARDGKLTLEDMAGGTFTISNGGVFGSLYGTPIINLPQSAVLGMHAIKDRPVVVDGQIVIRPIMVVALTYDHRLLDGREAVTFLVKVRDYLEDPRKMLLTA